jgi:hypothetical protein
VLSHLVVIEKKRKRERERRNRVKEELVLNFIPLRS